MSRITLGLAVLCALILGVHVHSAHAEDPSGGLLSPTRGSPLGPRPTLPKGLQGATSDALSSVVQSTGNLASSALDAGANSLARSTHIDGNLVVKNTVTSPGMIDIKSGGTASLGETLISNVKTKDATVVNNVTMQGLSVGMLGRAELGSTAIENAEIGSINTTNTITAGQVNVGTWGSLGVATTHVR